MSRKKKVSISEYFRAAFQSHYLIIAFMITATLGLSMTMRFHQYEMWEKRPNVYFVNETPMMSTLDAYSWIRFAREYREGVFKPGEKDTLRRYPDFASKPKPISMLSFLIAKITVVFGDNPYRASIYLIPLLSSLFILPFSLYFFKLGYPASAVIGGFVGTFNFMYYTRTSVGRVDTDLLNLFFPFLVSLLILYMPGSRKRMYILSACCGVTMLLSRQP